MPWERALVPIAALGTLVACPSRPPPARGRPGAPPPADARPRPAPGSELRVRFVVDERFLAVHSVAYYHSIYTRIGRMRRGRRSTRRARLRQTLPKTLYRHVKARWFVPTTAEFVAFITRAQGISLPKFHTLRGSYRGALPTSTRWSFWSPHLTTEDTLRDYHKDMPAYVKQLRALPEFKKLLEQTLARKTFCERQWKKNAARSLRIMERLTGLTFRRCLTVYLNYAGMSGGRYLGRVGPKDCPHAVLWGGREDWPNYTTVYLWHELLHGYLPRTRLGHAVIQLLTDNELRLRLNGGKHPYPPFLGHLHLMPLQQRLLPLWKRYLAQKGQRRIRALIDEAERHLRP